MERTSLILVELRNVSQASLNAETGQRGYLITLDRRYLEPYTVGREQLGPALQRLRGLLGKDITPRQLELLVSMDRNAAAKLDELDRTVALAEQGDLREARLQVLSDAGLEAMQQLRLSTRELESIERNQLDQALARAEAVEGRVVPMLAALAAGLVLAILLAIRLVGHAARAEVEAAQAAELAKARDRADLLARELNHRVKNLFAVVLAIVKLGARNQPEARPVTEAIGQRIHALVAAHEITQGQLDHPEAPLGKLVEAALAPYRSGELQARIEGPEIALPARVLTPLGLVLHELATNAVKYGAWAQGGLVSVVWRTEGGQLAIAWRESGQAAPTPDSAAPAEPGQKSGFGTMMMASAARQLDGAIDRRMGEQGMEVDIRFPLPDQPA